MQFAVEKDKGVLEQVDNLLYEVLWKPRGMPNVRHQFDKGEAEIIFTAREGNNVVGAFVVIIYKDKTAELRHAAVLPEYQGQKAGKGLWNEALKYIKAEGINSIYVYARNTAIGFWEKTGFRAETDWLDHEAFAGSGIRFKIMFFDIK
ncbi:GNAT family N-acetyltransferase [Phosphitispora fastidiosa]|uniref:GNAT family N-acetyltransferase n=1 Tax=Phosphitispora fastidiosa TaxID=2837202 RepID=UPI001E49265C|nr:GNAT family N-acetyltransferase [Phosphitispora fastidiosa]MBU7007692.1 ribosomal protein S18 acetylase RimI-like enzyme [Phosphitispora fastidiosa]